MMNTRIFLSRASLAGLVLGLAAWALAANHREIDYSGHLRIGGAAVGPGNVFEMQARLYDASAGGSVITDVVAQVSILDSNGLFHAIWNIEEDTFGSKPIWLELGVRQPGSSGGFMILAPRQKIRPVPTSLHAQSADVATSLAGVLPIASLPTNVARLDIPQVFTAAPTFMITSAPPFQISQVMTTTVQNLTVANLSADRLDGLDSTQFWRRETNNGVSSIMDPDNRSFEIRMQNRSILRLQEGRSNLSWSLVGGSEGCSVADGEPGVVVGGGRNNKVESNCAYTVIAGGDGNRIGQGSSGSTIAGGAQNVIDLNSPYSKAHGYGNIISNARFAGVLLGNKGKVTGDFSVVVSGDYNRIDAAYAVLLSGGANQIQAGANLSVIGGGQQNTIHSNAYASAIGGGQHNQILNGANRSFIGGGDYNEIGEKSYCSGNFSGTHNRIESNTPYAVIGGGYYNLVRSSASGATIPGGVNNVAGGQYAFAAGHNAKAEHRGSMVFADDQSADFPSMRANEFAVRAFGGIRFETGGAGIQLDGQPLLPGNGGGGGVGSNTITAPFTLIDSQPNRSILRGVNEASNTLSAGICGESSAATGLTMGVFGLNSSDSGIGVYGLASSKRGVNYAVRGETESGEGYAGFFDGRVQIQGGTDAEPAGGGYLHIGANDGANLAIDNNELMARNNGLPSTLYFNNDGGDIILARADTGRVGVGIGSPTVKLDVNGEVRCVALTLTSSRRFKTEIEPLTSALDRINALRGVRYRWDQAHGGKADVGFVAEEVEPVLPEAVVREPDGQNVAGIKADRLTALAVEAIKELHRVVLAKDAEIAELRAHLEAVERRLSLGNTERPAPADHAD